MPASKTWLCTAFCIYQVNLEREDPGHGLWSVLQFNYLDPVLFAVVSSSGTEMVTLTLAEEVGVNRLAYSGWLKRLG